MRRNRKKLAKETEQTMVHRAEAFEVYHRLDTTVADQTLIVHSPAVLIRLQLGLVNPVVYEHALSIREAQRLRVMLDAAIANAQHLER